MFNQMWNSLEATQQYFCLQCAMVLNKKELLGQFTEIPEAIKINNEINKWKILESLSNDWRIFLKIFRGSLIKYPSRYESSMQYKFLD